MAFQKKTLNALKHAEAAAWISLVEAANATTARKAIETLGETDRHVIGWKRARAAADNFVSSMGFGSRLTARGGW